jgi:ferritin-like metal-binding protein YciE
MKFDTLHDLFLHELDMAYDAEQQILLFLPRCLAVAHNPDLKQGIENEMKMTQERIGRLEEIYQDMNQTLWGDRCKGMEGIIAECNMVFDAPGVPEVKDSVLIVGAQKILHYHLAGYGSARTFSRELGLNDVADLLQDSLDQLGSTDKKLSKLAEGSLFSRGINEEALNR